MADSRRITLTIIGLDKDGGDVELRAFLTQIDLFRKALDETRRIELGEESSKEEVYFKLVDLSHQSPARLVFEAVPVKDEDSPKANRLVEKIFTSIEEIEEGKIPSGFDYRAFEAYQKLPSLVPKKRIEHVAISKNGSQIKPIEDLYSKIDIILGPDESEYGTAMGRLEYLNLHANSNIFYIYPPHSLPKIKCRFSKKLRETVINAMDKNVTVYGNKKYKPNLKDYHPYEIWVDTIEVLTTMDKLPKLEDLKGIAPDATGNTNSEDFVRGIRDGW